MRKIIFTIFIVFTFSIANAQISIYEEKANSASQIIKLPEGMTYDEFLKIQKQIDWSKIIIASIVPGFIHFYTNDEIKGWTIFGMRTLGYGLVAYAVVDQYNLLNKDNKIDLNISAKQNRQNKNALLFAVGSLLNFAGFFYDWADGVITIEEYRNQIFFKYGIDEEKRLKLGFSYDKINNQPIINLSLNIR